MIPAPAQADPIVKRIRTSKSTVVQHIKETRSFGTGREGLRTPNDVTRWSCKGYHFNRAHKAKTWRCTVWAGTEGCSADWRIGKVRRETIRGVRYVVWDHDSLRQLSCPR